MKLHGLPSMVMHPPVVTFTFDLLTQSVCPRPRYIRELIFYRNHLKYLRRYCIHTVQYGHCLLWPWPLTFDHKSQSADLWTEIHSWPNWVKFPWLVCEIWCSQGLGTQRLTHSFSWTDRPQYNMPPPPAPFFNSGEGRGWFRGGTRGNTVPILGNVPERMETAFPLLKCLRTHMNAMLL